MAHGLLSFGRTDDGIMTRAPANRGVSVEFQPMSPEEVQRTVQFLLHQQAQFAADLAASQARFDERIEKLDVRLEQLAGKTDRVTDAVLGLTAIVGHVVEVVSELTEAQKRHLRDDHGYPLS
jgi:hypothetical protein